MKAFLAPIFISVVALALVWFHAGTPAFMLVLILSVLELTLSFDNAVVNASVLERMSVPWRRRFITWGIPFAVFGTRFLLPVIIVSIAVLLSPWEILRLAITEPSSYGALLAGVRPVIGAFGGTFLLMVALKYFFDDNKEVHWIKIVERHLVRWGRIEAIEIGIALSALVVLSLFASGSPVSILIAGIVGIILFILMEGLTGALSSGARLGSQGISLFLYLNVLDAAFSLDGVVGAFALTTDVIVIVVGLGIGAYFVRAITLYLVEHKTLHTLRYLEHGAHWAIFGLAVSLFAGLIIHVPEVVTGLVGLFFVLFAYLSSRRDAKTSQLTIPNGK